MPKIIPKIREQLLQEARRQIDTNGYAATTVRSVAEGCGIGVGTVYNYFQSKDVLIATFMLEEWTQHVLEMKEGDPYDGAGVLRRIYDSLTAYADKHQALFEDKAAAKVFFAVVTEKHKQLRAHIAEVLVPLCEHSENPIFLAEFIAESLLTWTLAGKTFEEIFAVVNQLINHKKGEML